MLRVWAAYVGNWVDRNEFTQDARGGGRRCHGLFFVSSSRCVDGQSTVID